MKNSNLKNTIIFIDKKAELEGKGKVPKLNLRKLGNDAKIIGYQEHKKIKIHEAKKQKFLNSKFYKFRKKIVLGFIVILSTLILMFLWNKLYKPSYTDSNNSNFKVENETLSSSNASTYSSIVKESVQSILNIKYRIIVEQLHKNGNLVFAKGSFNIPDKGDVNFDMILKNYAPYSLKVNGEEYIKK